MTHAGRILIATTAALMSAAVAGAGDVRVTLHDGRVTIVATDATLREILVEWARVGNTTIVNVDRVPGAQMTLQLEDVTEQDALDVLLRSIGGYVAAARPADGSRGSKFDRIVLLTTSPMAPVSQPARAVEPPSVPESTDAAAMPPVPIAPAPQTPIYSATPGVVPVAAPAGASGQPAMPPADSGGLDASGALPPPLFPNAGARELPVAAAPVAAATSAPAAQPSAPTSFGAGGAGTAKPGELTAPPAPPPSNEAAPLRSTHPDESSKQQAPPQ